ncbi:AMP-binding enzyme [Leptospira santarosai]|nr:AMP-binding enzyme [Leptospira santarosai]
MWYVLQESIESRVSWNLRIFEVLSGRSSDLFLQRILLLAIIRNPLFIVSLFPKRERTFTKARLERCRNSDTNFVFVCSHFPSGLWNFTWNRWKTRRSSLGFSVRCECNTRSSKYSKPWSRNDGRRQCRRSSCDRDVFLSSGSFGIDYDDYGRCWKSCEWSGTWNELCIV